MSLLFFINAGGLQGAQRIPMSSPASSLACFMKGTTYLSSLSIWKVLSSTSSSSTYVYGSNEKSHPLIDVLPKL